MRSPGPSREQFTAWVERLAIELLRECSVARAAGLLRAGLLRFRWDEARRIEARAVARWLSRRPQLGVDEKDITTRHRYLTVMADQDRSRRSVFYLVEHQPASKPRGRLGDTDARAARRDRGDRHGRVRAIPSVKAHPSPGVATKIGFDKFHLIKHLYDALDGGRLAEQRVLKPTGETQLTDTKSRWLIRPKDMTAEQQVTFRTL